MDAVTAIVLVFVVLREPHHCIRSAQCNEDVCCLCIACTQMWPLAVMQVVAVGPGCCGPTAVACFCTCTGMMNSASHQLMCLRMAVLVAEAAQLLMYVAKC